jgi:hypothetical protein
MWNEIVGARNVLRQMLDWAGATVGWVVSLTGSSVVVAKSARERRARPRVHYSGSLSLIRQEDRLGCGHACLAMIAGVSYVEARAAVKSRVRRSGNATSYADLRHALDSYEIAYEMNGRRAFAFSAWEALPDCAIVAVECQPPTRAYWHWIVFERVDGAAFVLDPARPRVVRRDVNRLVGRSYMTILAGGPRRAGAARVCERQRQRP